MLFVSRAPSMEPSAVEVLKHFPPRSIADLSAQRDVLLAYAARHSGVVLAGWVAAYITMQTFAVPGTLTLSLLAGALYGQRRGLALASLVSTAGSCSCYCLSWAVGGHLAAALWPDRLRRFTAEVHARRADLLSYVVFLRVTPLLPNTFINVCAPIVGVPLLPFALGTLIGCAPNAYIATSAGARLSELTSLADLTDARTVGFSLLVGCMALGSTWLKHRHTRREGAETASKQR